MQALKPSRIVAQPHRRILPQQPCLQANTAVIRTAESARHRIVYAKIQLVEALRSAIEAVTHAAQHHLGAKARKPLSRAQHLVSPCAQETRVQPLDALFYAMLSGGHELRRSGRSRCANIRG